MRRVIFLFAVCFCLAALTARAAHTHVQLVLSADSAKPGDTILVGVDLKMDAGWHTYWKNPGESGIATTIKWDLPPGVTAGEIQWPLPEKLPPAEVTTYGYKDEVMLLVPLMLATNLTPGPIVLKADVAWLECEEQCVPGSANVETTLQVGGETKNSADAAAIEMWKSKVPKSTDPSLFRVGGVWPLTSLSSNSDTRSFNVIGISAIMASNFDFFPFAYDSFEVQALTKGQITSVNSNCVTFCLEQSVKKYSGEWPKEISGVLVLQTGNSREGFVVKFLVSDEKNYSDGGFQSFLNSTGNNSETGKPALPLMLLYAFIGGLILNLMPCVLPVIALKILGFVSEAKSEPRRVRNLGLIYALGVLISFLVLAAVVIGVKSAGHHAGWGMQFGSPIFIVCLTTLVTLVALNLFGVFEVTLGGRALDTAGELASRHGAAGAFFNGVLATVLATPCTAPFLGAALGFAFAQSASVIILIFLTVGLGLASPYILLSWIPAWLKFLPKPGAWMEKFKIAMGFPMLATVVWLFNVAASTYGKNVLWLGIFLVVVALSAWIFGEFVQRGRTQKTLAAIVVLILLIGGYAFALEKELDWRAPFVETNSVGSLKESATGIDWQRWSPEAVAAARAAGKPVLVDFTADWCLTCQVNKKTSLEVSSVREKIKSLNAVAFIGDYTHFADAITTELNRYHRAGVPLVLVYPKNADALPQVLPEVLTPGIVLDALERAAK